VSQQPAFPVFCFEGQKVPYPASSFLPDRKLSWRTSHYYCINVVEWEVIRQSSVEWLLCCVWFFFWCTYTRL